MANIKISELNSLNQVDTQELNQVVGGSYGGHYRGYWGGYWGGYYSKKVLKVNINNKSFNNQNAQNFNKVKGGGKGSLTVAPNYQEAYNVIA